MNVRGLKKDFLKCPDDYEVYVQEGDRFTHVGRVVWIDHKNKVIICPGAKVNYDPSPREEFEG